MSGPEPTPLPVGPNRPDEPQPGHGGQEQDNSRLELLFDYPKLRLNVLDLNHPGASRFLGAVNAANVLRESVQTVLKLLYTSPANEQGLVPPGTRSVTLYLEDMAGVAYTKGSDLDDDHKEIRRYYSRLLPLLRPKTSHIQTSPFATFIPSKRPRMAPTPTPQAPTKSKAS